MHHARDESRSIDTVRYQHFAFWKIMGVHLAVAKKHVEASWVEYKSDLDRSVRKSNGDIEHGALVSIDPERGGGEKKLDGHGIGSFAVLRSIKRTFFIQRGPVLEEVNSYLVTKAPKPTARDAEEYQRTI